MYDIIMFGITFLNQLKGINMRILLIIDDQKLTDEMSHSLKSENYSVDIITDEENGIDCLLSAIYDVAVIDNNMCDTEIITSVRAEHNHTPVMYICGSNNVAERIKALDDGADDCLPKCYVYEELLARIRALTRRQVVMQIDDLHFADLSLRLTDMTLSCGYRKVKLSYKEFEVIRILILNSHSIVRKESLLVKIWGSDSEAVYNNVEAYISLLRKKLFQINSSVFITAIRGVGYQLEFKQPT